MDGWVGYFSLWATSSLRDLFLLRHLFSQLPLFSEQPLNWATSALTCLPASSSVASATQVFSSLSFYNAFSNLQLQSRKNITMVDTMRLATSSCNPACQERRNIRCFPTRSRASAFCHSRLQTRIAGASRQLDQRSRGADNGTSATQIRGCSERDTFFAMFFWNRALTTVSCTFCRPHVPKVLRTPQFLTIFVWNRAFATSCALFADLIFQKCPEAVNCLTC